MAATDRMRRWNVRLLTALAFACVGCRVPALQRFGPVVASNPPICPLADGNKGVTVAVVGKYTTEVSPEARPADEEIATALARQLTYWCKVNKENVIGYPSSPVLDERFAADKVITLEIDELDLHPVGDSSHYQGQAKVRVMVSDAHGDPASHREIRTLTIVYPNRPLKSTEMVPEQFRAEFCRRIVREMLLLFTKVDEQLSMN